MVWRTLGNGFRVGWTGDGFVEFFTRGLGPNVERRALSKVLLKVENGLIWITYVELRVDFTSGTDQCIFHNDNNSRLWYEKKSMSVKFHVHAKHAERHTILADTCVL